MNDLNEVEKGQLCQSTIESLYEATGGMRQFPGLLKKIIATKAWERRVSKGRVVELSSLRELITEKPIKGWGEDVKTVEAVIKSDPECLAMFREAMKEQGKRNDLGNNVPEVARIPRGNSKAFLVKRVADECEPEVVEAVMKGELSPNRALVQAGVRQNRQVYIPKEPVRAAEALKKSFGDEFLRSLAKAIAEVL